MTKNIYTEMMVVIILSVIAFTVALFTRNLPYAITSVVIFSMAFTINDLMNENQRLKNKLKKRGRG